MTASSLHVKLALLAAALLAATGIVLAALGMRDTERMAVELTQRLHQNLARDIVRHQPRALVDTQGRADAALVSELAMMVMKINPSVEVYVLDRDGRILAHALEGPQPLTGRVDLERVRALLGPEPPDMLPVLGDDPRQPGRAAAVSVAPVTEPKVVGAAASAAPGAPNGWVYVVLQGRDHEVARATLGDSSALRRAAFGTGAVLLGAMLVFALAFARVTGPLRRLAAEVESFRREDPATAPDPSAAAAARPLPVGGDEVQRLARATATMRERIVDQFRRIEDNDRTRRELIGNISHDLHTPLASVQGYLETVLLRGGALDATTREQHLRTALSHARRLDRRIADLFELSKLDAGRVQPKLEPFCLAELLQDVIQSYRLQAQQRGVMLELDAGAHERTSVLADIALIDRVLQNLVDNALRHTPQGGRVTLTIRPRDERHLAIEVSDTGSGIEPEHLPHVFERYWRADDARPPEDAPARSAGLGLAIVKRIVELHGSAVRVRSAPREGTTFVFDLPRVSVPL